MKIRTMSVCYFIAILAVLASAVVGEEVKCPTPVPTGLDTKPEQELSAKYKDLHRRCVALQARISAFEAECAGIPESDTARIARCQEEKRQIEEEWQAYADDLDSYEMERGSSVSKAIEKLRALIASDQEAIRQLGFQDRAAEFEEWKTLTDTAKKALKRETIQILLRLGVDELAALVKLGKPAVASFDLDKAKSLIKKLAGVGVNDPYLAEAIRAIAGAGTRESRLKAADMLVAACQALLVEVKAGSVMNSETKLKTGAEAILEAMATAHSPQLRLLVGATEIATVLALAVGQQRIIAARLEDLTQGTEQQIKRLKLLGMRLETHVRELEALKKQQSP